MRFSLLVMLGLAAALSGCGDAEDDEFAGADFEGWYPQYNRYIRGWLEREAANFEAEIAEIEGKIAAETDEDLRKKLEARREEVGLQLVRTQERQQRGDYFQFATIEDLPANLSWQDGQEQPDIGDPECKKGGTFRFFIPSFPPTIRPFGPEANNSSRGDLYDYIEIALVDLHPTTGEIMPGVAREWAVGDDGKTVFFRIDPDAAYTDGVPVKAVDFMWFVYVRASDNVSAPWFKQYLREQLAGMTLYGEDIIAVTLPDARPKLPYFAGSFPPAAPHFYAEYGPDYEERYQWRVPPTTAAYTIRDDGLVKGVSITLSRVEDWWAKDKKFYRYRFNADRIRYTVVRDSSKAWELFRAGELDYFSVTLPQYWYEDSEMPPVFDGYVERYTWYNQYPRIPWALYLNMAKQPLDDLDVRIGICHAVNWQKVIDVVFRGDASRLPGWTKGYGRVDNESIVARPYSVSKAREHFAKAGFTEEGRDGILRHPDGQRLEVVVSYGTHPVREKMMAILKEEARKAGLDLVLDSLDPTLAFQKQMKKEHQMVFSGWGFQPPYPRYYEYFHSSNAYDDKGNLKQDTNNVFSFADDRMDQLALAYRYAQTEEELIEYAHEMQQIIHDSGVYIPGYMTEFSRIACWRWLRWPDSEYTELAPPLAYIPMESYVYWIDEEMQAETRAAMRSGETFPEVQEVKERYRVVEVAPESASVGGGADEPAGQEPGEADE